ncbi:hypothetical protein Patl1_11845 [Pistacia atlantica]|uniref:Uncharacterized protein n=1 Tax=Pistacia atlantica TaxID=434234 RepID=A0ACC1A500_9ROSI|nr:hypothetical protein Patl1_11845 [Pistacia atlantica]
MNFKTRKLSLDKTYEVMKDRAKGWDKPITLKFQHPNGETKQTTKDLSDLETNVWIQLTIGEFNITSSGMSGDMKICLSSPDAQEKTRLAIREIDITDCVVILSRLSSPDAQEKTRLAIREIDITAK